jgi:hypothetical protein
MTAKNASIDAEQPTVTVIYKSILKVQKSPVDMLPEALRKFEFDRGPELTSSAMVNCEVNVVTEALRRAEERRRLSDAIARVARKNWQRNRMIELPTADAAIVSRQRPEMSVVPADHSAATLNSFCGPKPAVVRFDEVVLTIDSNRTVSEVPLNDVPSVLRSRKRSGTLLPVVEHKNGDDFPGNCVVKSMSSCMDNGSEVKGYETAEDLVGTTDEYRVPEKSSSATASALEKRPKERESFHKDATAALQEQPFKTKATVEAAESDALSSSSSPVRHRHYGIRLIPSFVWQLLL